MSLVMGPLHFYRFVFIGALAPTLCSLVETSELPELILRMNSQDFEYILSWEGNYTWAPVYYSVKYGSLSSWITVMECFNITRPFCNLTKELTDPNKTYIICVEPMRENGTKYSPSANIRFTPYFDTCLSPAEFNVSACSNCANVTIKVSSSVLELYQDLDYNISVTTASSKVQEVNISGKKEDSFYYIIENLNPNSNYCISVGVSSSVNKQCTLSPPKCIIGNSKPDFPVFLALGVMLAVLVPVLLMLLGMYLAGFLFLRIKKWPRVLKFTPKLAYSVFESKPEVVHPSQVIICETQGSKKRECGCSSDDDSESDLENDGFYTNRKVLGKASKSCSAESVTEQLSTGCFSAMNETVELLDAEATTIQNDLNREEDSTASTVTYPPSVVSCTDVPEPEHCNCLNVNLNTVVLRASGENGNIAETLIPYEEDASDLKESCISGPSEPEYYQGAVDVQKTGVVDCLRTWQNSNSSAESESSDSEVDTGNGYLRR